MKTRKRGAIVAVLVLMALIARTAKPQIMFAQAPDNPIRGSWEMLKAIPPGDEVALRLRNGRTLKGKLINVSDTVMSLSHRNITTDVTRADTLRVYRVIPKSAKRATMMGLGIGAGVGGLAGGLAAANGPGEPGEYGWGVLIVGVIGAGVGALTGYLFGSRKQRELIYETR
jgi:hypothetical protein